MMKSRVHIYVPDYQLNFLRRRRVNLSGLVRAVVDAAYAAGELDRIATLTEAAATEYLTTLFKGGKRGRNARTKATAPNGASAR